MSSHELARVEWSTEYVYSVSLPNVFVAICIDIWLMPYVTCWLNQQLLPRLVCLARATPILSDWWRRLTVREWDRYHRKRQVYSYHCCYPTPLVVGAAPWVERLLAITRKQSKASCWASDYNESDNDKAGKGDNNTIISPFHLPQWETSVKLW